MAYLDLDNVRKTYGAAEVIPGVDLAVEEGEFVCLVGPSGSGKSTLLRMIAGLEEMSGGTIRVDGEDITGTDPSDRDMAMVFQSYALYPHMSVADNITFALRMRGTDKAVIDERLAEAITMLDLHGLDNRKPRDLSGGQRQRVAMGRCIVRKPKLFLFDEPLSNLDAKLRTQTRHQIRHLHERLGATSIFVTHDQVEAMTMADRIALLNFGEIQQIGTPQELYLRPSGRFAAGFLGSPEMNFFTGTLSETDGGWMLAHEDGTLFLPTGAERKAAIAAACSPGIKVEAGVRPEHLTLGSGDGISRMRIETIEWLGHEAYVFGRFFGREVAVRASTGTGSGETLPKQGDVVEIRPMQDAWHLFDTDSGVNLIP